MTKFKYPKNNTGSAVHRKTRQKYRRILDVCYDKNHPQYYMYGKLGITVCDIWRNDYDVFVKDMGNCVNKLVICRIDKSKNFTPDNCYWGKLSTAKQDKRTRDIYDNLKQKLTNPNNKYFDSFSGISMCPDWLYDSLKKIHLLNGSFL